MKSFLFLVHDLLSMIKYIHPISTTVAQGDIAEIYAQIKRDFGRVVEPFTLYSPVPKLLAGGWMVCRETEVVGNVSRPVKEAVAATVSMLNRCPYCVDAHTIMLASAGKGAVADAISKARFDRIDDHKMGAIVDWVLATGTPGRNVFVSPPFSPEEAPEIIGTAVYYHFINRLATVLLGETPLPSTRPWLRRLLKWIASLKFRSAVGRSKSAGDSLGFLPVASEVNEPLWAKTNPVVAQAFARFAEAVEEVGKFSLPKDVRDYVSRYVGKWNGETPEVSKRWAEAEARNFFAEDKKSACELALLAALSPHQISREDIVRFQRHFPGDNLLLGSLAWASFTAACRIGTWLQQE